MDAKRYQVVNGNAPNPGKHSRQIVLELEEFIDYAKIMMKVLGYKVFAQHKDKHVHKHERRPSNMDKVFSMKYGSGRATGKPTDKGFMIFKGSTINPETTKSCPKNVLKAREELADKINDAYELTSDILMTSPSTAAGFIAGTALNGNKVWRDSTGNSLNQSDEKI